MSLKKRRFHSFCGVVLVTVSLSIQTIALAETRHKRPQILCSSTTSVTEFPPAKGYFLNGAWSGTTENYMQEELWSSFGQRVSCVRIYGAEPGDKSNADSIFIDDRRFSRCRIYNNGAIENASGQVIVKDPSSCIEFIFDKKKLGRIVYQLTAPGVISRTEQIGSKNVIVQFKKLN